MGDREMKGGRGSNWKFHFNTPVDDSTWRNSTLEKEEHEEEREAYQTASDEGVQRRDSSPQPPSVPQKLYTQ
jgi:hypothetical protein